MTRDQLQMVIGGTTVILAAVGLLSLSGSEQTVGDVPPAAVPVETEAAADEVELRTPIKRPTFTGRQDAEERPEQVVEAAEQIDEGTGATVASVGGSRPHSLGIPSIDVDNGIVEVGLNPDGSMEIPKDVQEIGWYTPTGVRPGDEGSAVMAGHVDSRAQGRGAFFDLQKLGVGEELTVETEGGEQVWVVTGRTQYDKDYLPIDEIFTTEGEPRLVLITCGGPFDSSTRHYTENTVVYASLRDEG